MAIIRPFRAFRPLPEKAALVACRPYDVLNTAEARAEAQGNPLSFYHVIKPEMDFPDDHNPYDPAVYASGKAFFEQLVDQGVLTQDPTPSLYLYRQIMDGRAQTGLVAAAAVSDYFDGVIKIHEYTRPDKEEDRRQHVRISNLNYEPVFFSYPHTPELDRHFAGGMASAPMADFESRDGIRHTVWAIRNEEAIRQIVDIFAQKVPFTYVADGHHRTAAAAGVGKERREANPDHTGEEPYNFFLAVHFPDKDLRIFDYNRVVKDLNGHTPEGLIEALKADFEVSEKGDTPWRPDEPHTLSMYLRGKWYALKGKSHTFNTTDPIADLDVTVLTEHVLKPHFGIVDQRTDKRIDFVGGIRGLEELALRVDSGEMAVAFALYPVSMAQLMAVADAGLIMPPKSTWFEPKLRSGLLVYSLTEA
jgi:uncharacterized protein (DUF1015 family)